MTRARSLLEGIVSRSIANFAGSTYSSKKGLSQNVIHSYKNSTNKITSNKLPLLFSYGLDEKISLKDKIAFIEHTGQGFSFGQLAKKSVHLAKDLKYLVREPHGERIAFLCERDFSFPTTLGAVWWAGHIAIPLTSSHPESMLEHFLKSTSTKLIVTSKSNADRLNRLAKLTGAKLLVLENDAHTKKEELETQDVPTEHILNDMNHSYENKGAVILFTSGTTGKPKGVLLTHGNLKAQVENICGGWNISEEDIMLHVLPLHHTHGLIHAMLSPLAAGASCFMLSKFDANETWQKLLSSEEKRPSIFTAVPTVFVKLIYEYDHVFAKDSSKAAFVRKTCKEKMRPFVSGSASLPVPILEKFQSLSGHKILERYGMTETGLILCNPLSPSERKSGYVGMPLETVKIAVAEINESIQTSTIIAEGSATRIDVFASGTNTEVSGDLLVKGPSVFKEYWGNPEATKKEFTEDGWFKTGDSVEYSGNSFKILGRKSVDIIKSGGYKLSALEIETQLLSLKEVKEVAVLGLQDPVWGQKVAALIVWTGKELSVEELRILAKEKLPTYACPNVIKSLSEMPRNHLGKVNKKELAKFFD